MFHKELLEAAKGKFSAVHGFILQYLTEDNTEVERLRRNFLQLRKACTDDAMKLVCIAEEKPTAIQKVVKSNTEMKVWITLFKAKNRDADN